MQDKGYLNLSTVIIFCLCLYCSCNIGPRFSIVPEIAFVGLSTDSLVQGSLFSDSLFVTISFRDGDGDLGSGVDGVFRNIIMTDNRTGDDLTQFKVPDLDLAGAMTGIEGEIVLKLFTTCCLFPQEEEIPPCSSPSEFPTDLLTIDIQMVDDSGNMSNIVTTSEITLFCE